MTANPNVYEGGAGPWDEEHVKALLSFPRYSVRLVQDEPWQSWVSQRGGLKGVYEFLRNYSFSPGHRRILDVVLSNPDEIADVYANHLNISRATYFYRLRELVPAVVHALNTWQLAGAAAPLEQNQASQPARLPAPLTALVGAETALQSLMALISRDDVRMLTLLGPGGVGKTRLGIELAKRLSVTLADQVYFVDLADLPEGSAITPAIRRALGQESTGEKAIQSLLGQQGALLLLDNFEHVLAQAATVGDLLVTAPGLKIIVTSRAALHVYGEYQFIVPALRSPGPFELSDPAARADFPAVALFVERAQAVNPAFELTTANAEAVAELCTRLDGIPLSIELAAFQAKYYSPQAMLVRLATSRRLNFLDTAPKGLHAHQRTPRELLDWSYLLLPVDLQALFSRLAVFAGGCTIDSAEAICDTPGDSTPVAAGLAALAEQSLLQQQIQADGEPRYSMLGVTREYALEQLNGRGETGEYLRRFSGYFLQLAETPSAAHSGLIDRERDNLAAALEWYLANQDGEGALRLLAALWESWRITGDQQEAYRLMQDVLEQTPDVNQPVRLLILRRTGWLAFQRADIATMSQAFQEMLVLAATLGDDLAAAQAEIGLAEVARCQGRWPEATERRERALALLQPVNGQAQIGWAQLCMARIAFSQGDADTATACCEESITLFDSAADRLGQADTLTLLGQLRFEGGHNDQAALLLEESLHLRESEQDLYSAGTLLARITLARLDMRRGRLDAAADALKPCITLSRHQSYPGCLSLAHEAEAQLATRRGDLQATKSALQECLQIQESIREGGQALGQLELAAQLLLSMGEPLAAARLLGAADHLRGSMGVTRFAPAEVAYQRNIAQLESQLDPVTRDDAWLAGQGLTLEQAMIYARRCLQ